MNIRFLCLVFLFAGNFLIASNSHGVTNTVGASCPFGYRNEEVIWSGCYTVDKTSGGYRVPSYQKCENTNLTPKPTEFFALKNSNERTHLLRIAFSDCAGPESDDPEEGGCFGNECKRDKECKTPSGDSFWVNQGSTCSDRCQVKTPTAVAGTFKTVVKSCDDIAPDEQNDGPLDNGPPRNGDYDCSLEPFMCDYDTNKDGQIDDQDNPDQWPDPTGGLGNGEGCISSSPSACDQIEEHHNTDIDGDGNIGGGDGSGGDGSGGNGSGGDGSGGDGSGGDGSGGDGSGDSSGDGIDGTAPCSDYNSCKLISESQLPNCDPARDVFTFFYENPENFTGDCITCSGPSALNFEECQADACPFGFDSNTQKCWGESCKFGDCPDPDSPDSTTEPPKKETPPENDQIVPALRDILREIQSTEFATSSDIEQQTQALDNAISNLKNSNKTGSEAIVSALESLKNSIGDSGDGNNNPDTTLDPVIERLDQMILNQKVQACISKGFSEVDAEGECVGELDPSVDFGTSNLESLPDAISNTGIGSSISRLSQAGQGVTSECGGVMVQSFRLKLGNFVDTNLELNVCQWIEPFQDFIRLLALMFWGFLSFRVIFEA